MDVANTPAGSVKMWNKSYLCVIISNFMLCMGHASINPLVATYTKYLNTTAQMTGFLAGMFFAVSFACHPFAGPAMTKLDKRKLLIFVFLIGAAANIGYALFHSVPVFIAFRFLSGVQYSFVGPLLLALCSDHLPQDKLAYGLGMYGVGGAIANAVAPSVGETVLNFGISLKGESFGFTVLFLFSTFVFILATIPSMMIAPDKKTKEDIASAGAWYKSIFSKYTLSPAIVLMLVMIGYSIINSYMFEFSKEQGFHGASIFFLVLAVMLAISRPFSGFLTSKFGVTKILFPALTIFAVALIAIGSSHSLWMALIGAVLAAIGYGSTQPSLQAMGMQTETALRRGVASNTMYMGSDMGLFLGPYLGGLVYAKAGYVTMYRTSAVPIVMAIICLIFILPGYKRRLNDLRTMK